MKFDDIASMVDDCPREGRFSVQRRIFTDPEVFDLEMRHIYEGTWIFLGLASQAPQPHDFFTTWVGRQPVVVMRDADGRLGAFLNTCRHRGAQVCTTAAGNARVHVCKYHSWAYDSSGRNVDVKLSKQGCYAPEFAQRSHDLTRLAHFGEYRGFLFGSVAADVPALEEHLGGARAFLDLVVDQGPQGVELVPGNLSYTYRGNWKLQVENCADTYHLTSAHRSYMSIVERRKSEQAKHRLRMVGSRSWKSDVVRGSFTFGHGHTAIWGVNPEPEIRPLYAQVEELRRRVGERRTDWMLGGRNLTVYPSMQLADSAATLMRVIRPLAVDRTEMRLYCIAPVGEAPDVREYRIRQFEDFFNATGMATPDDNIAYEQCQTGYGAEQAEWQQGYDRGFSALQDGPNDYARELGVEPVTSLVGPFDVGDETVFHAGYREWIRLMRRGFQRTGGGERS